MEVDCKRRLNEDSSRQRRMPCCDLVERGGHMHSRSDDHGPSSELVWETPNRWSRSFAALQCTGSMGDITRILSE
jgi:hypothetical protein